MSHPLPQYAGFRSPRRKLKDYLKRRLRDCFEMGQRFGVDVLPRHFYSQVPDFRELRRDGEWRRPFSMKGVVANIEEHFEFVERCCGGWTASRTPAELYRTSIEMNGDAGYGLSDAEFLYHFVRTKRPKKITQIGAGVATAVTFLAAEDAEYSPEITCVDPYPTAFLRREHAKGTIRLIERKAQSVDLAVYGELQSGDLLFIDSTHTIRPGSEVTRLILEVIPSLNSGCFVHFHDIWFPYDYSPTTMTSDLFWWHESVFLHAFLVDNARVRLRASLSYLYHSNWERLRESLKSVQEPVCEHGFARDDERYPCAAYLEVVQ